MKNTIVTATMTATTLPSWQQQLTKVSFFSIIFTKVLFILVYSHRQLIDYNHNHHHNNRHDNHHHQTMTASPPLHRHHHPASSSPPSCHVTAVPVMHNTQWWQCGRRVAAMSHNESNSSNRWQWRHATSLHTTTTTTISPPLSPQRQQCQQRRLQQWQRQ